MTPLETLREMVGKATPGPWSKSGVRGKVMDGQRVLPFHNVGPDVGPQVAAVWYNTETHEGYSDALHIVTADRLSRFLVSPEAVEEVARAVAGVDDYGQIPVRPFDLSTARAVLQLLATKALGGEDQC